ncbi:MAG: hypothetical protein KC620_15300 [Myxococcales bacterium]|nr:hypothetical protein [Myxococcales bacterium]
MRATTLLGATIALALLSGCDRNLLEPPDQGEWQGELPACGAPLAAYFDRAIMQPPGENSHLVIADEIAIGDAMSNALAAGVRGDFATLQQVTAPWGYTACFAPEAQAVLLRPEPGRGLPLMAWRLGTSRPFLLEVPHPFHEVNTLAQGVEAFLTLGARALIVSGTHRCASDALAECNGESDVCEGGYRKSDPAHNPDSVFHAMHVALADTYFRHYAISLHGLSGPDVIVSDGTEFRASGGTPIADVATHLRDVLAGEVEVMSCNGVRGMVGTDSHCGTTNAQGRHLNESANVCGESADTSSYRFVHLEQPRYLRDAPTLRVAVIAGLFAALDPED